MAHTGMSTTYEKSDYTSTVGRFQSIFQNVIVSMGKIIHTIKSK
jgi:hypothetical protein